MDRLQAMAVFVRVAEANGFAAAARHLHMSPPAVTRAVAALEDEIGARLLTRTTRAVALTEAGQGYLEDCRRILAELAEADKAAAGAHGTPSGLLNVTASVLFGHLYVVPILLDFMDAHPAVTVRALFLDRIVNLVDEGIDVAVRIGPLPDSGYSALRVGAVRRIVCASPEYLARAGVPLRPADLAGHRIVAFANAGALNEWRFGDVARTTVSVHPRMTCNTNEAAIATALAGWGLTRVLSYQVGPALREGALVRVLQAYEGESLPVHVMHPAGRHAAAKVRAFVDFAAARLRAEHLADA